MAEILIDRELIRNKFPEETEQFIDILCDVIARCQDLEMNNLPNIAISLLWLIADAQPEDVRKKFLDRVCHDLQNPGYWTH